MDLKKWKQVCVHITDRGVRETGVLRCHLRYCEIHYRASTKNRSVMLVKTETVLIRNKRVSAAEFRSGLKISQKKSFHAVDTLNCLLTPIIFGSTRPEEILFDHLSTYVVAYVVDYNFREVRYYRSKKKSSFNKVLYFSVYILTILQCIIVYITVYILAISQCILRYTFLLYHSVYYGTYSCYITVYITVYILAISQCILQYIFLLYHGVYYSTYSCYIIASEFIREQQHLIAI